MPNNSRFRLQTTGAPLYIVSGGTGASGELLARTVLAQFREVNVPIIIESHVHDPSQVAEIVSRARQSSGTLVHSMVNAECRKALVDSAQRAGVAEFDIAGPLLNHLASTLEQEPQGQPGLYRRLHATYFKRVEAIEFAVAHDDGQRIEDLADADIILIGVSRAGKTPLSMYLAMLGWKVANIPLVPEIPMPKELHEVDSRRVIGLTIEPMQLTMHRRSRQPHLGIEGGSYSDRQRIAEELRSANHLCYRHKFTVIDMTDKPVESSGEEVVAAVTRQLAKRPATVAPLSTPETQSDGGKR